MKNEDFLEAKRLKEAIERLKQIGMQLRQLDERKNVAIQNEDYDSANIIKIEIDKLRNAVAPESLIAQRQPMRKLPPEDLFSQPQSYPSQEYPQENEPVYQQQQQQ